MKEQTTMQLGMIGLGRMGANMVRRLLENGQKCVVFDRSSATQSAIWSKREQREPAHWQTSLQSSSDRERSG